MIRPESCDLAVSELRLDPDNPRFVTDRDTSDLPTFLQWFNADADLLPVASSIAVNGYHAAEPLLVAPRDDPDPRLVVVEGNRRFAAVLLLRDPGLLPRSSELRELAGQANLAELETLPCLRYTSRNDILDYLGNRHVVGVKEWKPLSKARYVRQLRARALELGLDDDDRALAKRIGSNAPYVRRLLNSLDAFEAVTLKRPKDEARFSLLSTALQYSNIAEFVGIGVRTPEGEANINLPELQELADWTLDPSDPANPRSAPRVNSRRMDLLNDVVAHQDALAAFRSGSSIDHAHRLTGAETTALLDALNDVSVALTNALALVNRLEQRPTSEHRAAFTFVHEQLGQLSDALDAAQARADGSAGSSAV